MNYTFYRTSPHLQQRKSSLAFGIRVTVFLGVVIFYCIFRPQFISSTEEKYSRTSGRKLLGIIPQALFQQSKIGIGQNEQNEKNRTMNSLVSMNLLNKTDVHDDDDDDDDTNKNGLKLIPLIKVENNIATIIFNFSSEQQQLIDDFHLSKTSPNSFINNNNCTKPTIYEFPRDGFTREQRKNGWIIIHILLACYCFWLLAVVCDDYFVPAIDLMCSSIEMEPDVVGATLMAAAVSTPELFVNCIGTFITKTDLGTGTIVGSAVFNILAVPACCGLFTGQMDNLDWWPISRDCSVYCLAILCLIGILYDGKVMWYEALILIIAYFVYMAVMCLNKQMARKVRKLVAQFQLSFTCHNSSYTEADEITPLLMRNYSQVELCEMNNNYNKSTISLESTQNTTFSYDSESIAADPWTLGAKRFSTFVLRWPITFVLWLTTPDCRKHPNLKYMTFIITVCWLAITSYLVSLFITYVGDTLNIPDSVMGLTILAAGMSIPEAVSSVLVTNQGFGAMGISNSIGSNTFGILIGLGLPWFVKSFFLPSVVNEYWIILNSSGLTYSSAALLVTLFGFYTSFLINKFYLNWKLGISCTTMYIGFLILATMLELNFFSNVNLPVCEH